MVAPPKVWMAVIDPLIKTVALKFVLLRCLWKSSRDLQYTSNINLIKAHII